MRSLIRGSITVTPILSWFPVALTSGSRLGPYEVVSALGAGGMGEVYRATDTKLGRSVAIKILPDAFTSDPDRVARFEREARVLASLNHPHIAAIYGLEESGERKFLVMELVEGPTLDERLVQGKKLKAHASGLPQEEALHIAQQIAEALEAAHEQGIVHRDLKPSNVKVTPDNNVKLLDFGLAKGLANADVERLELTDPHGDGHARGRDHGNGRVHVARAGEGRSGRSPDRHLGVRVSALRNADGAAGLRGDSVSEIVARVIEREPDWRALPPALHPRINELLRRCLEKDPKRRRRDIGDVRIEIEHVLSGSAQAAAPLVDGAPRHRSRLAWVVATWSWPWRSPPPSRGRTSLSPRRRLRRVSTSARLKRPNRRALRSHPTDDAWFSRRSETDRPSSTCGHSMRKPHNP